VCGCTPAPDPCGTLICGNVTDSCGKVVSCGHCAAKCCGDSCVCATCMCF
jgi:hypothetical protein